MTPPNPSEPRLAIVVNDQPMTIAKGMTIEQLLRELELPRRGVAVELNREIVPHRELGERLLQQGDRVEVVALVGGG